MSIITFNGTSGFSFEWDFTAVGLVTSASSTEIILALDGGGTLTLGGTFPTLDPITSRPTSGTIDTIDIASGGETIAIMTSLSAFDFFTWVDANDGTAFNTALLAGNDTITGTPWNDNLIGLSGNDTVYTGGGQDAVHTGAGDDIIALTGPILSGSNFNGGDDDDTIRASIAAAAAPVQPTDLYSTVGLFSAIVSGVETIEFDSQSGEHLRVGMGVWQIGQVTGLTGGDGSDQLLVIVPSTLTTSFTLAPLTLTDWNADDSIMLLGSSPVGTTADFTLDSSAYGGQALLIGGAGNDTLTSGAGNDLVVTGGGLDVVDAGAGDDIINLNGTVSGGSVFDGGDDDDTAIFSDASTDHAISAVAGQPGAIQVDGFQIIDIEHLQFTDGTFHWDTTSGLVADGYLSGTTVWHDDGNGILDPYEPFAITDANGNFELSSYIDGPLLAMGGINIDTGLPNDLLLSAPAGSTVVNPLTTLVQTIIETSGADSATAEDQVKAALGLDPSLDLTTLDLIAAAASGDADALEAQKAAASVAKILDTVVDNGGNPDDALAVLASQIVAADDNETTLDLGDGSEGGLLDKVFTDAGVPEGDIDDLIAETQETIENIEQAETLDDISDVQAGDLVDVTGGNGKDVLDGFDSNDRLSGKNGSDILHGGGGSDLVLGGNGKDELHGGDGADVLAGGNGPDTMWGDAGNDIFAFAAGESAGGDVVKDFDVGDKLFLAAGLGVASKTISGGSTVLSLSDGGTITLEGYAYQGDYNDLLLAGPLPLWAQSWTVA